MSTMKAARFHGQKDIRIENVPIEAPPAGHVQLKIGWCGICGTDLHEYEAGPIFCPTPDKAHPLTNETSPVTMGHEFAGTIVQVASDVKDWKKGDRVVVEPVISCRKCYACDQDLNNACTSLGFQGLSGFCGGLAEFANVQVEMLHKLPDNVDMKSGAMVEPLAVAMHAVEAANFQSGQTALVCGSGPIGCFVAKSLAAKGASKIIVSEPSASRRRMATAAGAHHVLNPKEVDVVANVKELTGGADKGVDASFDCAGVEATINTAIAALRTRGVCVNVAIWSDKPRIDMNTLLLGERTLKGVICYRHNHEPALKALERGDIKLDEFVTATIKLDDLVDKGFKELIHNNEQHVKILVNVTGQEQE